LRGTRLSTTLVIPAVLLSPHCPSRKIVRPAISALSLRHTDLPFWNSSQVPLPSCQCCCSDPPPPPFPPPSVLTDQMPEVYHFHFSYPLTKLVTIFRDLPLSQRVLKRLAIFFSFFTFPPQLTISLPGIATFYVLDGGNSLSVLSNHRDHTGVRWDGGLG